MQHVEWQQRHLEAAKIHSKHRSAQHTISCTTSFRSVAGTNASMNGLYQYKTWGSIFPVKSMQKYREPVYLCTKVKGWTFQLFSQFTKKYLGLWLNSVTWHRVSKSTGLRVGQEENQMLSLICNIGSLFWIIKIYHLLRITIKKSIQGCLGELMNDATWWVG